MVELTDRAATEILKIAAENGVDGMVFLRTGVKGGGCSGFSYSLDITDEDSVTETDERFEHESDAGKITVLVDSKSNLYMGGTTIDFKDEIMARGFVFNNPNATSRCGCGSSFSV